MEKNIAANMRGLADDHHSEVTKKKQEKHRTAIVEYILPNVENRARDGDYCMNIDIPSGYDMGMLADGLRELGFAVERMGRSRFLTIKW